MRISADQFVDLPLEEVARRLCGDYFAYQATWDPSIVEVAPDAGAATARVTRNVRGHVETGTASITSREVHAVTVELVYPRSRETRRVTCTALRHGGTRVGVEITTDLRGLPRLAAAMTGSMLERALALSLHSLKEALEKAARDERPA